MTTDILAVRLSDRVALTVRNQGGGWLFDSWRAPSGAMYPPPPNEDCDRTFATSDAAIAHFGTLLGRSVPRGMGAKARLAADGNAA